MKRRNRYHVIKTTNKSKMPTESQHQIPSFPLPMDSSITHSVHRSGSRNHSVTPPCSKTPRSHPTDQPILNSGCRERLKMWT
ncbi:hypothetical protein TNIN_380631 [Trichonephila inaurata madagascariensis]|uniref:Uncharacterized protein n=1 Tax=Trichonephila inaurata madagascariensis TaxID=2747483 RepID=A0A8X6MI42_9ARAC|nr:hypothetical protein TNIN_380631 [Trichonephila inaurata madagascariensis]